PVRAAPASQPHTLLITQSTVPGCANASSTWAGVFNSLNPTEVRTETIGAVNSSGYMFLVRCGRATPGITPTCFFKVQRYRQRKAPPKAADGSFGHVYPSELAPKPMGGYLAAPNFHRCILFPLLNGPCSPR